MSAERLPVTLLHNTATGRFHPLVFRPSPRPSEVSERVQRHHSVMHHTEGFATREEAIAHVEANDRWRFCDATFRWDGEPFESMRWYFAREA